MSMSARTFDHDLFVIGAGSGGVRAARIAAEDNLTPKLLLQVKLRPDPTKGGFAADELKQHWSELG